MKNGQGISLFAKSFFFLMGSFILLLTSTSCQKQSSEAIIVIATDSLSFGDISCSQGAADKSGFATLCDESIRFTHAYTPSILSAPAIASILTGLYPFQHGLRHNGSPGLSPTLQTFGEVAVEKGYRTAFFSGGPPIFKKTGLNQGFELFDDSLIPTVQTLHKPFRKNIESFEKWLKQEVDGDPFIAFFYVPDLAFLETKTSAVGGDTRSQTFESQLEELDSQLLSLIEFLKKRDLWRNSVFIFTGLQGRATVIRKNQIAPMNLHNESVQVPLFMKPPQKIRDSALHWTVDRNVSLVDLGMTIYDFLGAPLLGTHQSFPAFSLRNSLLEVDALPPGHRTILIESGWAHWKKLGPVRVAGMNYQDYLVYDERPQYFNLLTDRFEQNPLPLKENNEVLQEMIHGLEGAGFEKFSYTKSLNTDKFSIPYMAWVDPAQAQTLHQNLLNLYERQPQDPEIFDWLSSSALEVRDTETLKKVAKNPLWKFGNRRDACWAMANQNELDNRSQKNCPEEMFRDLMTWMKGEHKGNSKEWARQRFAKSYVSLLIDRKIYKTNKGLNEIWDISPNANWRPTYTDILFSRPENLPLKQSVMKLPPYEEGEF